ncbi:MAG: NAD-dependent epimerase/dehydratase family protein [Candidatus Hydrogenedens sp.]|nr:NAD-dependent epimerase/dehydratase family protein [Candidatus Hydrogenedens sp.]
MSWNGKTVTVTGAAGFIGSHLTERLLAEGARVRAMTHGRPGHLAGIEHPGLTLHDGCLLDEAYVRQCIEGAQGVFHLGAVTSVAYSYDHPEETVRTNVIGTLNVCAAARDAGIERLVHTSTAGAYGNAEGDRPITEAHPLRGCNPYTAAKIGGDRVAETYHLSYDLPVTTVRLFNVFGPRMGAYLIMPSIISQLLAGPELRLGDLTPTRTFTFVDDIVDGFLRASLAPGGVGELVHFGAERVISMQELVDLIAGLMGVEYQLIQDAARLRPAKSEIFRVRVDSSKARELLGWQPTIGLEEGLRRTIDWMRQAQTG